MAGYDSNFKGLGVDAAVDKATANGYYYFQGSDVHVPVAGDWRLDSSGDFVRVERYTGAVWVNYGQVDADGFSTEAKVVAASGLVPIELSYSAADLTIKIGNTLAVTAGGKGGIVIGKNISLIGTDPAGSTMLVVGEDITTGSNASSDLVAFGKNITFGGNSRANAVVVGNGGTFGPVNDSVVVGRPDATGASSVIIGRQARTGQDGVAVGRQARADNQGTAIGRSASTAGFTNSTAVGRNALCTAANQMMLGTASIQVEVPGKLVAASIKIDGMVQFSVYRTAVNETLTRVRSYVNQTAAGIATLLWATPQVGDRICVKNTSAGVNTVGGNGNTIEGVAAINLLAGESVELIWDATAPGWIIF